MSNMHSFFPTIQKMVFCQLLTPTEAVMPKQDKKQKKNEGKEKEKKSESNLPAMVFKVGSGLGNTTDINQLED